MAARYNSWLCPGKGNVRHLVNTDTEQTGGRGSRRIDSAIIIRFSRRMRIAKGEEKRDGSTFRLSANSVSRERESYKKRTLQFDRDKNETHGWLNFPNSLKIASQTKRYP